MLLPAIVANAGYHHFGMAGYKTNGQTHFRYGYIIKADCFITIVAYKVNMIVVVMPRLTIIPAKGIFNAVVGSWNMVYNAFFHKGLQCAVNRYPVKTSLCAFFNICMCQRSFCIEKKFKNFFPAAGYTQLVFL